MPSQSTELASEPYHYDLNDGTCIEVSTDPAGLWRAGVSATVWDSSLILAKHFEKVLFMNNGQHRDDGLLPALSSRGSFRSIEVGAGCSALPSLVLHHLLKEKVRDLHLTVTDKEAALPLLYRTINQAGLGDTIHVRALDWTSQAATERLAASDWDIILAADLLAFPDSYQALFDTIVTLSSQGTLVYLAYERRDFEAEVEFFRLWGTKFRFEMVPEDELDDVWRAPGEIYLYRGRLR